MLFSKLPPRGRVSSTGKRSKQPTLVGWCHEATRAPFQISGHNKAVSGDGKFNHKKREDVVLSFPEPHSEERLISIGAILDSDDGPRGGQSSA